MSPSRTLAPFDTPPAGPDAHVDPPNRLGGPLSRKSREHASLRLRHQPRTESVLILQPFHARYECGQIVRLEKKPGYLVGNDFGRPRSARCDDGHAHRHRLDEYPAERLAPGRVNEHIRATPKLVHCILPVEHSRAAGKFSRNDQFLHVGAPCSAAVAGQPPYQQEACPAASGRDARRGVQEHILPLPGNVLTDIQIDERLARPSQPCADRVVKVGAPFTGQTICLYAVGDNRDLARIKTVTDEVSADSTRDRDNPVRAPSAPRDYFPGREEVTNMPNDRRVPELREWDRRQKRCDVIGMDYVWLKGPHRLIYPQEVRPASR